jgi:ketosteroid isomerase-like protein
MIGVATIWKSSGNEKGVYAHAFAGPGVMSAACRATGRLFDWLHVFYAMFQLRLSLAMLACLVSGCASAPPDKLTGDYQGERARIQSRLHEIFDAAEKKDLERLDSYHFYGPKFTKFGTAADRLDAERARQDEHQGLARISDLSMRVDDLKIDVFGEVGIATFIMHSDFREGTNTFQHTARSTLVFVKDSGAWKITHEHFSSPKAGP